MSTGELGKTYQDGEIIIREGEAGDRMYVVQSGRVAVTRTVQDREIHIAELGKEDVFGEMALFERESRSATVRAVGPARVLSVDKKTFLRRVHEDPSLAYRVLQQMSRRIRATDAALAELKERAEGESPAPALAAAAPDKRAGALKDFVAGLRRQWKPVVPGPAVGPRMSSRQAGKPPMSVARPASGVGVIAGGPTAARETGGEAAESCRAGVNERGQHRNRDRELC